MLRFREILPLIAVSRLRSRITFPIINPPGELIVVQLLAGRGEAPGLNDPHKRLKENEIKYRSLC